DRIRGWKHTKIVGDEPGVAKKVETKQDRNPRRHAEKDSGDECVDTLPKQGEDSPGGRQCQRHRLGRRLGRHGGRGRERERRRSRQRAEAVRKK
ncbi:hypothetical protein CH063_07520, partial [Colletotrichum higginsianum]